MDEELTELLATGERAAFHGRPAAGVAPLQRAVEMAHAHGRDAEATAAAWLLGVFWMFKVVPGIPGLRQLRRVLVVESGPLLSVFLFFLMVLFMALDSCMGNFVESCSVPIIRDQ